VLICASLLAPIAARALSADLCRVAQFSGGFGPILPVYRNAPRVAAPQRRSSIGNRECKKAKARTRLRFFEKLQRLG